MLKALEKVAQNFKEKAEHKKVRIISHHDTDGITSAAILAKTLKQLDISFSIGIVKALEKEFIKSLPKDKIYVFLDLGSSSLQEIANLDSLVLDHHEIIGEIPKNINLVNPHQFDKELSGSCLTYLFSKCLVGKNKELANLATLGMVGDMLDKEINNLVNSIIKDAEVEIKKGPLFYPATRPIDRTLLYSSSFFIPGVTGNSKGVFSLLREVGIKREGGKYKSLVGLNEEETSKLLTAILLRLDKEINIIGNIYLIKFFNKIEDARELSAMINACSRLGHSNIAISLCLNNPKAKKTAESLYINYKQHIISALNHANNIKIQGKNYLIINAKDEIKDTIIGTIASIISKSPTYNEGTIVVSMAYDGDKIKVSTRVVGKGRNVRELLESVVNEIGGECGGHHAAAGCLIAKQDETKFLDLIKKQLDIEVVKV